MREWAVDMAFTIYEFMYPILGISFIAIFFVLIPLGLFDKTRGFAAVSLYLISYVLGFSIWIYSAGIALGLLGWTWLIIGLFLVGLGVIPVAFFGTLFLGYYGLAFGIALSAIFPLVVRRAGVYLLEKHEMESQRVV